MRLEKNTDMREHALGNALYFCCFSKNPRKAKPLPNSPKQHVFHFAHATLSFVFEEYITNNSVSALRI